ARSAARTALNVPPPAGLRAGSEVHVLADADPGEAPADRESERVMAERDRADDSVGGGIDARQRAGALARDPDRPLTDCDTSGYVPHGDASLRASGDRIDPANRVVFPLRDPYGAEADCDSDREPPDRNASRATTPRIDA